MSYKNILILTNGYTGSKVLQRLKQLRLTPFVATSEQTDLRKKASGDILSFSKDFQVYEVNGESYSRAKDILPNADIIICIDWKKDYFKNEKVSCLVYYTKIQGIWSSQ